MAFNYQLKFVWSNYVISHSTIVILYLFVSLTNRELLQIHPWFWYLFLLPLISFPRFLCFTKMNCICLLSTTTISIIFAINIWIQTFYSQTLQINSRWWSSPNYKLRVNRAWKATWQASIDKIALTLSRRVIRSGYTTSLHIRIWHAADSANICVAKFGMPWLYI